MNSFITKMEVKSSTRLFHYYLLAILIIYNNSFQFLLSPCFGIPQITPFKANMAMDPKEKSISLLTTTNRLDLSDINASIEKSIIFDQVLGHGYDTKIRPVGLDGSGPLVIYITLFVRNVENIDDFKMEYAVQLTFRQSWTDPRVRYSHLLPQGQEGSNSKVEYLQLLIPQRIWMPDVFFSNEKKSGGGNGGIHDLLTPNLYTWVYPDGRILQSYRISLILTCKMLLKTYPLDFQSCPLRMGSYGWTTKDLLLKWDHTSFHNRSSSPIEINAGQLHLPQFRLQSYQTQECISSTATGDFSCIQLILGFQREFGFYLIQIYVPCVLLVCVSWVAFWLEPTAVEARVSLGVTTILTIVTQTYGINESVPPVSYIKALDVWTSFCQIMIFGALLQFSLVNYMALPLRRFIAAKQGKEENNEIEEGTKGTTDPSNIDIECPKIETGLHGEIGHLSQEQKCYRRAKLIDRIARVLFPASFALFNIVYWSSYLGTSYQDVTVTDTRDN